MTLYRIEEPEYDYSPTIGIFESMEKVKEYFRSIDAVFTPNASGDSWDVVTKTHYPAHGLRPAHVSTSSKSFVVYELELNVPGEKRI